MGLGSSRGFCCAVAEKPHESRTEDCMIEDIQLIGKHKERNENRKWIQRIMYKDVQIRVWRDGSGVKSTYALVEDPSSVPSSHMRPYSPLSAAPPPEDPAPSSGLHKDLPSRVHTHTQGHTDT